MEASMGFERVYSTLLGFFPQIDTRVLKAVAIEHSNDVDSAVLAVLEDIIPFFTEKSTPSSPLSQSNSISESSNGSSTAIVDTQKEDGPLERVLGFAQLLNDLDGDDACTHHSEKEAMVTELLLPHEYYLNKSPESSIKVSCSDAPLHILEASQVDKSVSEETNLVQDKEDVADLESSPERSFADGNGLADETALLNIDDETVQPSEKSVDMQERNFDDSNACLSADTASNPEKTTNIVETEDQSSDLNATMTQSIEIRRIDLIEEIIADARNNKKTLFLAMENVISLMRQVEDKEKAAEQAKAEAESGGMDILNKVEELKKMLEYAKKGNNMDAGDVYGEKAILATELKELQSRVLSLSDERDKSLAILDEIRQSLEVQLAAVENEIKSAEQEKLEKENAAHKLFADQELVMEKVVQESKNLKQMAEENAKLQEFLTNRGCTVDALQGEVAAICQDVMVLKEKFDLHLPLNESLFRSQTSFILASSTSSLKKSLVTEQVPVVDDDDLLETQKHRDDEATDDDRTALEDEATKDDGDRKALEDDGWEFFVDAGTVV